MSLINELGNFSEQTTIFEPNYLNLNYFFKLFYLTIVRLLRFFGLLPTAESGQGLGQSQVPSGANDWSTILFVGAIFWLILAGLFFLFGLYFELRRQRLFNRQWQKIFADQSAGSNLLLPQEPKTHFDWAKVQNYISSDNPSDWRMAIFEADKMLEEMLRLMNLPGETVGDKLKSVEPGDWLHLTEAWEAHKTRNRLAHELEYQLSRHEAQLAISQFEQVLSEFEYI